MDPSQTPKIPTHKSIARLPSFRSKNKSNIEKGKLNTGQKVQHKGSNLPTDTILKTIDCSIPDELPKKYKTCSSIHAQLANDKSDCPLILVHLFKVLDILKVERDQGPFRVVRPDEKINSVYKAYKKDPCIQTILKKSDSDIHVVTNSIKKFFKNLDSSIIPKEIGDEITKAESDEEVIAALSKIPEENKKTVYLVLQYVNQLSDKIAENAGDDSHKVIDKLAMLKMLGDFLLVPEDAKALSKNDPTGEVNYKENLSSALKKVMERPDLMSALLK